MKKLILNVLGLAILASALFTSCDETTDDNSSDETSVMEYLELGILNGNLEEDYTLTKSSYALTGSFIVKEGTLTIPAGTQIVADASGVDVYIAVMQGAKIDIQGTESDPVLMSSLTAQPGDWGGLTICGNATTTAGADAEAEVGGFIYGGDDDEDNSGSISYLVIKGTGAQINEESQYNGVSFYAVGSGTTVDNVAVINGSDDGVEFFGGTVSVSNLYLENCEDDAVDWTEGWSGSVSNTYISHSIDGFSTAFEGDKANNNPIFTNVTSISTTGGTALQFKKESGASISNLYLNGYDVDIDVKDEGNSDYPNAGTGILIEGAVFDGTLVNGETVAQYKLNSGLAAAPTVDVSTFEWADAAAVEVEVYEGSDLQGQVNGYVTLDASVAYTLSSSFIVNEGASLTIPSGTQITVDAEGVSAFIAVMMGGQIYINGTAENPVVMSSVDAQPGDWGGLTICGEGITSAGENAEAEVGGFIYGGTDSTDNSGSISYLIIKGTGAQINEESQYNGVSLYAVGSGTSISNVAVINGQDDGIEFFGGSVEVSNLYLENCEDDAVDWTEEWNGGVTNTYIVHDIDGFSTAFEGDKGNANPYFNAVTAISSVGGTALQFKKESGASITDLYLSGYEVEIDVKDEGNTDYPNAGTGILIEGVMFDGSLVTGESVAKYTLNSGMAEAATVDSAIFDWVTAE